MGNSNAIPAWAHKFQTSINREMGTVAQSIKAMISKVEEISDQAKIDHDRIGKSESTIVTLGDSCDTMKQSISDLKLVVEGDNNGKMGLVRKQDKLETRINFVLKIFSILGGILLAVVTALAIQLGIFMLKIAPVVLRIANAP